MTIVEFKQKKAQLKEQIEELISLFECESGVDVSNIFIGRDGYSKDLNSLPPTIEIETQL